MNIVLPVAAAVLLLAAPCVYAQGRGPGGPRPGPGAPGGHPGFGGSGGGNHGALPFNTGNASIPSTVHPTGKPQFGPPGRWWDNSGAARMVGLRREQQKRMDTIFNASKPALIERYQTLQHEEAKLASISKQAHPEQARLFAAIDSVNQARAELEKVTTQMLLQIRQQLDADQVGRMEALAATPSTESSR